MHLTISLRYMYKHHVHVHVLYYTAKEKFVAAYFNRGSGSDGDQEAVEGWSWPTKGRLDQMSRLDHYNMDTFY